MNQYKPRRPEQPQFKPKPQVLAQNPGNPRELALVVLDEHFRTDKFVATLLDARFRFGGLSTEDRRLAAEIVYGVVRRKATLDTLITPHLQRPRNNIEDQLWISMQIGVYQLVFMSSIPAHAAVNETVEAAKRMGTPRWAGILNGVLRSVERILTEDKTDSPSPSSIPLDDGNYRLYQQPIFPDPQLQPKVYVSKAFSYPIWLINRWSKRFDFDELVRLGFWFNKPPRTWLRVNLLKTSREQMLTALKEADIPATPGDLPESILLEGRVPIMELPGFTEGWFSVQDFSAMQVARLLAPEPGQTVLDLCAAPGTKTTHLAELMQNQGTLIATDVNDERLQKVQENADRLQLDCIQTQQIDTDSSDIPDGPFDAILVDVPCSNTGVLGKRPEVRWRIRAKDFQELPALQLKLLASACERLKPGGRLVYSTCSIDPDENQAVTREIVQIRPDLEILEQHDHTPGKPADGGYQALLRRKP